MWINRSQFKTCSWVFVLHSLVRDLTCNASHHIGGEMTTNKLLGNLNCKNAGILGGIEQLACLIPIKDIKGEVTILHTNVRLEFTSLYQSRYCLLLTLQIVLIIVHIHFPTYAVYIILLLLLCP